MKNRIFMQNGERKREIDCRTENKVRYTDCGSSFYYTDIACIRETCKEEKQEEEKQ